MPWITWLGNSGFIWIAIGIYFVLQKKYRTIGMSILISLVLCGLIGNLWLKPMIGRLRPSDVNLEAILLIARPMDYSFPSGHTLASFAAATAIFLNNRRFGLWAYILATLIAFSRLYLYVHYPTDILAGIILGLGIGFTAIFLHNMFQKFFPH